MKRQPLQLVFMLLFVLSYLFGPLPVQATETGPAKTPKRPAFEMNILKQFFKLTDDTQSDYPLSEIYQGCPKPDCIPAIDEPVFTSVNDVDFLEADDLIIAYIDGEESRVYATRILDFHEIVNDTIAGKAVAITYCPLCGTGVAFSRDIDGKILRLGVSGVLHGSDLVLYDDNSHSLWQQITGRSFAGPRRGQSLTSLPVTMTTWERWKKNHPESLVLKPPSTGGKKYKKDNYADYAQNERIMFGGKQDPRLHPKRVVHGFAVDAVSIAFDAEALSASGKHAFSLSGQDYKIFETEDGSVRVEQIATGKIFQPLRTFWFAWFTFHPETDLWLNPQF